jgi:peptide/nickel transport system substrate-binding protein
MKSWRTSVWYIQAFWQKYKKLLLLGIAVGIGMVWLFPRFMVLLPQQKQTKYIGRVGLYSWLDLPVDIREKMSVGLTSLNEQGRPIPVLAERWSVEEDGRVFRFLIKPDLKWQDGKSFNSKDVDYNFSDVQTVRTDNEVVFRLEDAYSPFPVVVSQPLFREVVTRRFGFWNEKRIVGLGEYSLVSIRYNSTFVQQLVMENDKERLIYRFYPGEREAVNAFRLGQVDILEKLSSVEDLVPEELQRNSFSTEVNLNQYVLLLFNTADPNLTREVRQSLNYAVHKPGAEDELLRALSPIAPTSWAYNATDEINAFLYDPARAAEMYYKVNPQLPLKLNLDATISLFDEAQKIAQDWQMLGERAKSLCEKDKQAKVKDALDKNCDNLLITVEVRLVRDVRDMQALLIGRETPPDPDQYAWWHSNQVDNLARYQNPRVDKLLEDARKETDQQKRKVMYFEFQKYLVEDVPAIFFNYVPEYTVERKSRL